MIQDFLDRISEHPQTWNVLRRLVENGFRGEKAVIAAELKPFEAVDNRRFLDLGCGTGEFAPCFPATSYVGIDLSPRYVKYANKTRPGSYAVMSGAELALADSSFDAALILGVLHHLPDEIVRGTVAELWRVLRPGAPALVLEDIPPPSFWNWPGRMMHWLDRGGFIREDDDYRRLFAPYFRIARAYTTRSGICDYGVYILEREEHPAEG